MPHQEWSFFMRAEDHQTIKWLLSFLKAKFSVWGRIILIMTLVGLAISSVGVEISAYMLPSFIFSLFTVSFLMSLFFKPTVKAFRTLPLHTTAGGECLYKVTITNTGRKLLRNLEFFDHKLPYGLYSKKDTSEYSNLIDWLEPGENISLTRALRIPRRGIFKLPPLVAGISFPTGIIRSLQRVTKEDTLTVFPKMIKSPAIIIPLRDKFQPGGKSASVKTGHSNEFAGTRDYRAGDRLKDVHWNSSARAGKLIVKEYVKEYFIRVGLFVDTELRRFEKHQSFESRISLCAGLAETFYDDGYLIDLFLSDPQARHWQIDSGTGGLNNLLENLCTIEGDNIPNLQGALANIQKRATALSGIILFLKDHDQKRSAFIQKVKELNIETKTIIITDRPLTLDTQDDSISVYSNKSLGQNS